jgi:glycerol uptake facilitator-like aquaporin
MKKYIAEFAGTCALTLAVFGSIALEGNIPGALSAGIVLGLLVFTIGKVSGAHVNPAVTLGALSLKKISRQDAAFYILAQFAGAALAIIFAKINGMTPPLVGDFSSHALIAEILGTILFTFGIASVVFSSEATASKASDISAPLVIGGSLTIGATIASGLGSNGVLNPAVAFGLGTFGWAYLIGPIVGSLIGMWLYVYMNCSCDSTCVDGVCTCPVKGKTKIENKA